MERKTRRILSAYLENSADKPILVQFRPVAECEYVPGENVLHKGRVGRLGPNLTKIARGRRLQAEIRSAILALAALDGDDGEDWQLTPKEIIYLDLLCDGINDTEAAERLSVSLRAIKARKRSVCTKTNSATINQAIAKYMTWVRDRQHQERDHPDARR